MTDPRRALPSVDRLLREPGIRALLDTTPRAVVVAAAREALRAARTATALPPPEHDWAEDVARRVRRRTALATQPVLNATGVVLHTNLGRAPLAAVALRAIAAAARGYATVEYDLAAGARGERGGHCAATLAELAGTEDALVVNNAAAALLLVLNTAAEGREVLISRGELVEIGGSFRIPEILAKSGAILHEVGTTNRTHHSDYAEAITPRVGALLTVHRSNFELRGFVTTPTPAALATLAHAHHLPYIYDIGSGLLADLSPWGLTTEPRVADAVASGADAVVFSGDKLLGGPQAGCLVGRRDLVQRCRRNPLARAARADKLTLAGLEATLALYREPEQARKEIPVLRMLTTPEPVLAQRAERLAALCPEWTRPEVVPARSAVGGGAFPGAVLPTRVVALAPTALTPDQLAERLRMATPPVVARVHEHRVLLDPRTLEDDDLPLVAAAVAACRDP